MTGPNHHFVSKLYLKWFTSSDGPTKSLYHLDKREGTFNRESIKRIGTAANFNTVNVDGVEPEYFEQRYDSDFERPAAPVLYNIWKHQTLPTTDSEEFKQLLCFIALLYVRNPSIRDPFVETLRGVQEKWESLELQLAFERLHGVRRQHLPRLGTGPSIPKEALNPSRSSQVPREFLAVRSVQAALADREWGLIKIAEGDQLFVTSDRPVIIAPVPPYPNHLPVGIGMRKSRVLVPLNSRSLLVGGLDAPVRNMEVGATYVRNQNSLSFIASRRSVFSPLSDFDLSIDDSIVPASSLLRE